MVEINNTTKYKINLKKTREIVEKFLRVYKKDNFEISVAIIGAARMRYLNKRYRGQDKATDVLAFSKIDFPKNFLGEVVINISETKKFTKYQEMFRELGIKEFSKINSQIYLFYFLLIHGLLHLVGYEDHKKAERIKMLKWGKNFLNRNL